MLIWQNCSVLMALRMGVQLGIFTRISQSAESGITAEEITRASGASLVLVGMIRVASDI